MTKAFIRLFDYFQNHKVAYWALMVALFVFFGYFAM
jgi:preprotein translocase subunit SecY